MQITNEKVATFDFTLSDGTGAVLDSSAHHGPLPYIHGTGFLIPGLESALEGKRSGESFSITLTPAQGYGEREAGSLMSFPMHAFAGIDDLEVGAQLQVDGPDGSQVMTVAEIKGDCVVLDGNHPLAGMTLTFDISIVDVRDATPEELAQGYPEMEGCGCGCAGGCDDESEGECESGGSSCGCGCGG